MNLLLLLFTCLFTPFVKGQTTPIPPSIHEIKKLSAAYVILYNTFDPRETEPNFFVSDENQAEIYEFAKLIDNIFNELENNPIVITVPRQQRYNIFLDEVDKLQNSKDLTKKPLPFKVVRFYFRNLFEGVTSNSHADYCRERNKFLEITNEQIQKAIKY
jgi:hypothetical protein